MKPQDPSLSVEQTRAIERASREEPSFPIRLQQLPTADIPPAADTPGAMLFDLTTGGPKFSNGTAWSGLQVSDATLTALAAFSTNGFLVQTAADTFAGRTLSAPAAGLTISNPAGTAGNPTFALADDLAALEALSGTNNIYYRSGVSTWTAVTVSANIGFSGGTLGGDAAPKASPTFTGTVTFPVGTYLNSSEGLGRIFFNTSGATNFRSGTDGASQFDWRNASNTVQMQLRSTGLDLTSGLGFRVGNLQVLGAQGAAVADASGGATIDTQARAAINALLARCRAHGIIAT